MDTSGLTTTPDNRTLQSDGNAGLNAFECIYITELFTGPKT